MAATLELVVDDEHTYMSCVGALMLYVLDGADALWRVSFLFAVPGWDARSVPKVGGSELGPSDLPTPGILRQWLGTRSEDETVAEWWPRGKLTGL